ncbi:MAG: hypothetical protein HQ500_06740 [Flavobacteriales bacterium]|nr:hypothetical protein [Flavobacteriales bacterium]
MKFARPLLFVACTLLGITAFSSCKEELCDDTCYWPADGVCDDGGEDSANDYCKFGTDCADCGTRIAE